MQELLLQSHRGEDSTWMVNYKKCPHFLFPISILVGGNYDLLRNTQNTNGAMWKDISVTDLQPQSVTSKYWCCKGFQFRKAVETNSAKPPQVRAMVWGRAMGTLDVDVKLCGAGGRRWSGHMEEAFGCQSHDAMAQIANREWGNPAKQGNWEHKAGSRKPRRKAKSFRKMQKKGYVRRMCGHPISPPALPRALTQRLNLQRGSHALCSQLVSARKKARGQEDKPRERSIFPPIYCFRDSIMMTAIFFVCLLVFHAGVQTQGCPLGKHSATELHPSPRGCILDLHCC